MATNNGSRRQYVSLEQNKAKQQGRHVAPEPEKRYQPNPASQVGPAARRSGATRSGRGNAYEHNTGYSRSGAYTRSSGYERPAQRQSDSRPAAPQQIRVVPKGKRSGRSGRNGGGLRLAIIALAAAVLVTAVCMIVWVKAYYNEKITPGITINMVDVSGMTREEALEALSYINTSDIEKVSVVLRFEEQTWQFGAQELSMGSNLEQLLDEVMALGRTGSFSERRAEAKQIKKEGRQFNISLMIGDTVLSDRIDEIKAEIDKAPVDATITFDPKNSEGDYFTITDDAPGYVLNKEKVLAMVEEDLKGDWQADVQLTIDYTEAEWTRAELEACTGELSFFETELKSSSSNRTHNVKLSLEQFNGMVLWPGEEVSFNNTTGQRTLENGYLEAPVINKDKGFEDALGGGVCQSSTTIYNAALLAGMEIVERNRHSFPSTYVKTGFDAMVSYPGSDLIIKNNAETPIFIRTRVSGGKYVRVWMYGAPLPDGMTIEREYEITERLEAPEPEYRVDKDGEYVQYADEEYVYAAQRNGIKVKTYRIWKKDGEVVEKEELFYDKYPAIGGVIYIGAEERATPTPTPSPTPTVKPSAKPTATPDDEDEPEKEATPRPSAPPETDPDEEGNQII